MCHFFAPTNIVTTGDVAMYILVQACLYNHIGVYGHLLSMYSKRSLHIKYMTTLMYHKLCKIGWTLDLLFQVPKTIHT